MTVEEIWYSMFSAEGAPPHSKSYCRLPMDEQWSLAIDLAISFAKGEAGYRKVRITKTGEVYWHWPRSQSDTGWWLIPSRIERRVFALNEAATAHVMRQNSGVARSGEIADTLVAWKLSHAWEKYAVAIIPRTPEEAKPPKGSRRKDRDRVPGCRLPR